LLALSTENPRVGGSKSRESSLLRARQAALRAVGEWLRRLSAHRTRAPTP